MLDEKEYKGEYQGYYDYELYGDDHFVALRAYGTLQYAEGFHITEYAQQTGDAQYLEHTVRELYEVAHIEGCYREEVDEAVEAEALAHASQKASVALVYCIGTPDAQCNLDGEQSYRGVVDNVQQGTVALDNAGVGR